MIYHVSPDGSDSAAGTEQAPFRTINHAAAIACPGDTVRVHEGVYREWVDPQNGGMDEHTRIVYEVAAGERAVIKGSEIVTGWEKVEGTVYKAVVPNTLFGSYNPFAEVLGGDWFRMPENYRVHAGDVYLNGRSMYEASSFEDLLAAPMRTEGFPNWNIRSEKLLCPADSVYRWYAETDAENTTVYGNFQGTDPNAATVEINVRKCCFFPRKTGLNYITVRGFEMAHAATPWNPPTAGQIGMIGPHWAKGWIIENNDLHDAKTSAVCLGKESASGENWSSRFGRKSGHRYQLEAVFSALRLGWDKATVGSHIVRNNYIHDCGQNGVVGHMGAAFSRIEHNEICRIGIKYEFWGHELGGIKLHAAVDTLILNNNIHHCTLGTWLDWQAQGTRLSRNIWHDNVRDLFVEVTHGPCLVDNNLLLSEHSFQDAAQGTAFVHNVIAGRIDSYPVKYRDTPYHLPHSTQIKGFAPVYNGDDRIFNNVFLGVTPDDDDAFQPGKWYNFCQRYHSFSAPDEYLTRQKEAEPLVYEVTRYMKAPQPMWIEDNAYAGYAQPFRAEKPAAVVESVPATLTEKDGAWMLTLQVPAALAEARCKTVDAARLGSPRLTEEPFENPDGSPVDFTLDLTGKKRGKQVAPGAFASLSTGENVICVWKR